MHHWPKQAMFPSSPMYLRSHLASSVSVGSLSDMSSIAKTAFWRNSALSSKLILASKHTTGGEEEERGRWSEERREERASTGTKQREERGREKDEQIRGKRRQGERKWTRGDMRTLKGIWQWKVINIYNTLNKWNEGCNLTLLVLILSTFGILMLMYMYCTMPQRQKLLCIMDTSFALHKCMRFKETKQSTTCTAS